ncbi:hypothetical protein GWK47_032422 [Chionoecetes opilio]|uniref:Uncharacterized protein n=1 Tax=Chionoecetes opilio TaxID=41210 RepID=A0A8J4YKD2_CHIOP|nr:hypothetical protein GWK47_032422 [Chionoecetes opilio]
MQNVVRGSLGNSGKERLLLEGEKGGGGGGPSPLRTPNIPDNKCQAYADLQDKFFTVSGESDSEEDGEESEVEPFALGDGEGEEEEVGGAGGSVRNKFLLSAAAHATAATPELGAAAHHAQPHFDPDTHSRLVALLEAAGQYPLCLLSLTL